ncbi:MAG: hypothetical protein RI885_2032 [Actinomycetota bacterium]|jgi:nucleoside-diphosphate-sugar epimerase
MRVLVIGGTGFTGSRVVALALADGHEVTVLTRRHRSVPGASIVMGDPRDGTAVGEAVRDHDAVVFCLGVGGGGRTGGRGDGGPTTVSSEAMRVLVQALAAQGRPATRVVAMSNVGAGDGPPVSGWMRRVVLQRLVLVVLPWLRPIIDDKTRMERIILDAPIWATVVRFPNIVDRPAREVVRIGWGRRAVRSSITVQDAAALLLACATGSGWSGTAGVGRALSASN